MTEHDIPKTYKYIVDFFSSEIISDRYDWIYSMMISFIEKEKVDQFAFVSESILNHVIIDYFVDIHRLKEFQGIERTNEVKIFSYLSFWILRHKPIQTRNEIDEKHLFINEAFVKELLTMFLFQEPTNVPILDNCAKDINDFLETMLYYFKYRDYSAKSIEMLLLAFKAGRKYQYSVDFQV